MLLRSSLKNQDSLLVKVRGAHQLYRRNLRHVCSGGSPEKDANGIQPRNCQINPDPATV